MDDHDDFDEAEAEYIAAADARRNRLNTAIGGALDDGELLAGWVIVGKVIDADGDSATFIHTAPGQDVVTDLGLAEYAATRIRHAIVCHSIPVPHADDGD